MIDLKRKMKNIMFKKRELLNINWIDDMYCAIVADYGIASLVYCSENKIKGYQITEFKINSYMLCQGKGRELMDIIIQEANRKEAKFLKVIPDSELCYDNKDLSEALYNNTSYKNCNPQQYIEDRYKSYGFYDKGLCNDSSHHIFIKEL